MAKLTVKRPITLVVIVTEEFKEQLVAELQEGAESTQRAMDQMDFQARHYLAELQRTNLQQAMQVRQQIEAEKQKQEALKKEYLDRAEEAQGLELGSEFVRGTLEGTVDLEEGQNLFDKLGKGAVVVKDGVIVEIREP